MRKRTWLIVSPLALLAACLLAFWFLRQPAPNQNALALGQAANIAALEIPIQAPIELNFKSKADVLSLRTQAVLRYPELLAGAYQPSEAVFGQIVDRLPWWGLRGHFFYGSGERSLEGPAEETRFLLNPYLLVGVEFDGLSLHWDRSGVTDLDLHLLDFPFYCEAEQLRWEPQAARAEVTYALSDYLRRTARWTTRPLGLADAYFSLIAYNARDLNLNYLYVAYSESTNVTKREAPGGTYAIPHFIHQGGSCGYPGGCNNMSPETPEISFLELTGLPAQVVIKLWRQGPWRVEQPADMVFVIHIR